MGIDSKLWNKKSNQKIDCDRLYNLYNDYTKAKGLLDYLINQGLPKYMLVDLCIELNSLIHTSKSINDKKTIYEQILDELSFFDDNDIFILIDNNNDNYYKVSNEE